MESEFYLMFIDSLYTYIFCRVSVCFDGVMNGPTDCSNQCSISARVSGVRTWFMDESILKEYATGCGQAMVESSKMKMTFPPERILTNYGCIPTIGADKTVKLLVKSASESCKLKLVS